MVAWLRRPRAAADEARRSLPGDDLVPDPKCGYTQAITIDAPASEVWPWLVQIGHKRAGWYSHDYLHRLVGIAGCVDDERCSAKRIIPELQDLKIGDVLEIAPGMGYAVTGIEPEQALISHMRTDAGTWQSFASGDLLPEQYLSSSWVWILEEIDERTTRLIVRVRSDNSPGLRTMLMSRVANEVGRQLMQPKTLRVHKQRAEDGNHARGVTDRPPASPTPPCCSPPSPAFAGPLGHSEQTPTPSMTTEPSPRGPSTP